MSGQKMTQTNIEQKLISRIQTKGGRYISCNEGWYEILAELERKLNYLDPNYTVDQVKEKFGTLRFYFSPSDIGNKLVNDIMYDCVKAAEFTSSYTCEYCGSRLGKLQTENYWVKTACSECWAKKQEERKKRDEALTELVKFNEENGLYDGDLL